MIDNYTARRHAFVAQRDAYRAEVCNCGHDRGSHMEDVASCHACRCGSFAASEPKNENAYGGGK